MDHNRLGIVYIASNGRSGSTLLDLLLGAHSRLWTLGEFCLLPLEWQMNAKPCGCKCPVQECAFWGPIINQFAPVLANGSINRFRRWYHGDRLLHFKEIWSIYRPGGLDRAGRKADLNRFGEDNSRVLEAVLRRAQAIKGAQVSWLVDASKNPYRLLWLKHCGRFNLRVIHLVKDPRAFAYSMSKPTDGAVALTRVGRAALRWSLENHLFDQLLQRHFAPGQVLRLNYEHLAGRPAAALEEITSWLGVPMEGAAIEQFRGLNHGIAGNEMRHRGDDIFLDVKWRSGLPTWTQRLVRAATFLRSRRYGFAP
jgi:hypothetical protein